MENSHIIYRYPFFLSYLDKTYLIRLILRLSLSPNRSSTCAHPHINPLLRSPTRSWLNSFQVSFASHQTSWSLCQRSFQKFPQNIFLSFVYTFFKDFWLSPQSHNRSLWQLLVTDSSWLSFFSPIFVGQWGVVAYRLVIRGYSFGGKKFSWSHCIALLFPKTLKFWGNCFNFRVIYPFDDGSFICFILVFSLVMSYRQKTC